MKIAFVSAVALGLMAATPAMAEAPARYIQGNIGAIVDSSIDRDAFLGGFSRYSQDSDGGVFASIAAGQALNSNWTVEGEVVYAQSEIENIYNGNSNTTGSGSIVPMAQVPEAFEFETYGLLINANYEVYRTGKTAAYVGAGVGFGYVDYQEKLWTTRDFADDSGVMWQLKAGVTHAVTDKASVDLSYRYLATPEVGGFADAAEVHALTIGLRYSL